MNNTGLDIAAHHLLSEVYEDFGDSTNEGSIGVYENSKTVFFEIIATVDMVFFPLKLYLLLVFLPGPVLALLCLFTI